MKPSRTPTAHSHWRLALLLAVMVLAWSFNYIFGKVAIRGFAPASSQPAVAVAGARALIAAAVLLLLAALGGPRPRRVNGRMALGLAALGFTGIAINQYFFTVGLGATSVAHAALLTNLTPIFVLMAAALWGQERLTLGKGVGMALALAGVAALLWHVRGGVATRRGDLLCIVSSLGFAYYTVAGKGVVERIDTFSFTFYTFEFGLLGLLLPTWGSLVTLRWSAVAGAGWTGVAYMALAGSLLPYFLYYDLMKIISASQVAAWNFLQPVVAALAGWWLLSEALSPGLAVGGAAILAGLWLSERGCGSILQRQRGLAR